MIKTYTIDELINEYYDVAKTYFELNNIQISKTGIIGFLLYVLGYIKKDSEFYYNYLFKELSAVTAEEYTSLLLHGSLYGFIPSFAKPATFKGKLQIVVPKFSSNLEKREINIPNNTRFSINDLIWNIDAYISIIQQGEYAYVSYNSGDEIRTVNARVFDNPKDNTTQIIEFDLLYAYQYDIQEIEFTMPYYEYGTFYRYVLDLGKGNYLADIKVYIKQPESSNYEKFDVSFVKFGYANDSKVVFISQLDESKYVLEFGDGKSALYIPQNSEVKIKLKVTQGAKANILNGTITFLDTLNRLDYYIDGHIENVLIDSSLITGFVTEPITDGQNVKSINELRQDILNFIKTRNTLVKLDDYKAIFSSLYDTCFIFRKSNLVDNNLYIYGVLIDKYLGLPIESASLTFKESDFNPENSKYIYLPEYTYIKKALTSVPFEESIYVVSDVDASNTQIPISNAALLDTNTKISFEINPNIHFKIKNIDKTNNIITIDSPLPFSLSKNTQVLKVVNKKVDLISPFLYVKNDILNTYDAKIVNNKDIFPQIDEIYTTNEKIPNFKIQMDLVKDSSSSTLNYRFKILEIDDLSNYYFSLSIDKLDLVNEILNSENNFEYKTEFDIDIFSLPLNCTLEIYNQHNQKLAKFKLINFKFIYDISDILSIKRYIDYSTSTTYLIQIPFLSKEKYLDNKDEILNQLINMLYSSNLSEYRLPTVSHEFRLSNTLEVDDINIFEEYNPSDKSAHFLDLPLKLNIKIYFDKNYIIQNNANIYELIDQIKLDLAKYLHENFFTHSIKYYTSKIVDLLHNYPFVKYAKVITPNTNIVMKDIYKYLDEISSDKLKLASFNPVYFWFDLNDINVEYELV